jgi:response regulator of citrate/malate metabolism
MSATAAASGHRGGPRVALAPFREWLFAEMHAGKTIMDLANEFGVSEARVEQWLYRRARIELYTADHYLCRIGRPDLVSQFWPLEDK